MRRERRRRVFKETDVRLPDGNLLMCSLRDISEVGARLTVEHASRIPAEFELRHPDTGDFVPCRVERSHHNQLGVQFLRPQASLARAS